MQRKATMLLAVLVVFGSVGVSACVVAPPRARVVAVAPARVWVPGHWQGSVWIRAHWRYR
jgi:hypothetical protein